jgi:hypothetical protein
MASIRKRPIVFQFQNAGMRAIRLPAAMLVAACFGFVDA